MSARPQAWLEIDLDALGHNISILKELAGPAALAAVVKANAYGLGAYPIAGAALAAGADRICVFNLDEAQALRSLGCDAPILVMGYLSPDDAARALTLDVALIVAHAETVSALADAAAAAGRVVSLHVKVDSGMHRIGVIAERALELVDAVRAAPSLALEGFCTHFPSTDEADADELRLRFERFDALAAQVGAPVAHAAATATLLRYPAMALDMVRVGIGMYGSLPGDASLAARRGLRPVIAWKATLVQLHDVAAGQSVSYGGLWTADRDSRIGVVSVGYADGFRRSLSNRGAMLVNGARVPVVGTVCMDMTLVDLTDAPPVRIGGVAVMIGQDGSQRITLDDFAGLCDSISHEVCTGFGPRQPRVYLRAGRPVSVQTMHDRAPVPTRAADAASAAMGR